LKQPPPPPLFIGKKGGASCSEASGGRFLSAPQLLSSPPFCTLRKIYGSVSDLIFIFFFSSLSPILSEICLPKVFGNFTEVLRKLRKPRKPFFNKTWRSLPPSCFLLKHPNFQNVSEGPSFEFLFTPYLDMFTPYFYVFGCFLSKISQNFTDSTLMSVKPSEAINNGTRMKL